MRMVLLAGAAMILGCGSGATAEPPEVTSGDEQEEAAPPPVEEPAVEEAAPAPSGPATVAFKATVKGEAITAKVKLINAAGETVAEGETGQTFTVTSGEFDVEISIEDAKILADKPTQHLTMTLEPGSNPMEDVKFPWANVQLNVRLNGKLNRSAFIKIKRQGEVVVTVKSNRKHIMISPGRYTAEVKVKGAIVEVEGLLFPDGATQGIPVNVQL